MVDPDEKELILLLKNDSKSAIKLLFEKYHSRLCSIAYRLIKDKDLAKDIVQEVFIKFWSNRAAIDITTSLAAYLRRSVINTALNYIQKEKRHPKGNFDHFMFNPVGTPADQNYSVAELSRRINDAVDKLPVRTRAVFLLIRQEELSYKEVSESLNISLKAVEKEMMMALKKLREMLKEFLTIAFTLSTLL